MAKGTSKANRARVDGKAGSGASAQTIKNALAGNKVDLDYALMKRSEYGNIKGGGTKKTREAFEMWNDEVKRLQEERRTLESVPKINNPAKIPNNAITEQEFLTLRGVGYIVSGYGVDRIGGANMTRMSEKQRTAAKADIAKGIDDYHQKRSEARAEYKFLVDKGVLRDKTSIEKIITKAHGNPDSESTQAARRMSEKKGYDWKTGKKLKK